MLLLRSRDGRDGDPPVERRQPPAVRHGEREEIDVRQGAVRQRRARAKDPSAPKRHVVGPEDVPARGAERPETGEERTGALRFGANQACAAS